MEKFCLNFSMHKKALTCQTHTRARRVYHKRLRSARECVKAHSFLRKGSLVFLAKEQIPVQAADHNNAAEDIADGGRDQIVEDKGSDI